MKPQISSQRRENFPSTDYQYQATRDASCAVAKETAAANQPHGFWKLGTKFHRAEAVYGDAADFFVFTLMGLFCAWPIVSVGTAIAHVFLG